MIGQKPGNPLLGHESLSIEGEIGNVALELREMLIDSRELRHWIDFGYDDFTDLSAVVDRYLEMVHIFPVVPRVDCSDRDPDCDEKNGRDGRAQPHDAMPASLRGANDVDWRIGRIEPAPEQFG